MNHPIARPLVLFLLIAVAIGSTGCQSWSQMKNERDALYRQNRALQDAKDRLEAENARLMEQLAAMSTPAPAPAPSGFSSISGIEVDESTAGQITVRVPGDVLFNSGQATLTSSAQRTLAQVAGVLKTEHAGSRIIVEGHSDSDPIRKSKWASNHALSEARADAVANYLATQGVPRDRMTSVGYGPDQPRGSDKAKNRRVELVVVK